MNKRLISLFSAIVVSSMVISCGDKKTEDAIIAPAGMHTLDLSRFGKPFAIFVPDTVAARLQIIEQSNGALDIKVGKNFAVSINEQAADIELRKQDVKTDEVNKLKGFITDEASAIMWESEIVQPEFHFLINLKIANSDYNIEDIREPESNPFSKDAIQKMFESAKKVVEIKKEKHS
jgi:hypothetical protein